MLADRFDHLTRLLAHRTTRRSFVAAAATSLFAVPGRSIAQDEPLPDATPEPTPVPVDTPTVDSTPTFAPEPSPSPSPATTLEPTRPAPSPSPSATPSSQPRPEALPRLALSVRSGKPGAEVDATLTGFKPGERVNLRWYDGNTPRAVASGSVTSGDSLTVRFTVPRTFAGSHRLRASGSNRSRAESSFHVKRAVTLSPRSGPVAGKVIARATGFTAGADIELFWFAGADRNSGATSLGVTTTSATGSGRIPFFPPTDSPGAHRIEIRERSGAGQGVARFTLECDPGLHGCDDTCVDLASDSTNCGGCAVVCAADEMCSEGACLAPPPIPAGVTAVYEPAGVRLTWKPVETATGFRIAVDDVTEIATVDALATTFADVAVRSAGGACYWVQAFNPAGASAWSNPACAVLNPICVEDTDCQDDLCAFGVCEGEACGLVATACTVRPLLVIPSDVTDLPADDIVLARMTAAMERVAAFFRERAELTLRYDAPQILRTRRDSLWLSTPFAAAEAGFTPWDTDGSILEASGLPGIDANQLLTALDEAGLSARPPGAVTLAVVASTLGGGSAGGIRLGSILRTTPDSGPAAGPGPSGIGFAGQWVLDTILTGDDSASCLAEMGSGAWQCPADTAWGTLIHELGHGLGLAHACEGWYREHWAIPRETCGRLIMQSHFAYPNAGFDPREIAILRLSKVFA